MYEVLAWVFGVGLLVLALIDAAITVVGVGAGRGPVTRYVSRSLWWVFTRIHAHTRGERFLSFGGPVILVAVIITWGLMTTTGWALIFGAEGALVTAGDGEPVPGLGRLYFASATVLGRGSPLYQPVGNLYQILEQVAGGMGVALFTLGIAYVIPVVNAVVQKRKVAAYISALGHSPRQILERAWSGGTFGVLRLHLIALSPMVNELAERHLAYPVLFYFHSVERHTAIAPSIAVLDETLTVVDCCDPEVRFDDTSTVPLRAAISEFLHTLYKAFIEPSPSPLPRPDLPGLRDTGVPLLEDEQIDRTIDDLEDRRRLLQALVVHDGWEWEDIERGAWTDGWSMQVGDGARRH